MYVIRRRQVERPVFGRSPLRPSSSKRHPRQPAGERPLSRDRYFRSGRRVGDTTRSPTAGPTPDLQNGRMNRLISPVALTLGLLSYVGSSVAGEPFTGTWTIDLRIPADRQRGAECGTAEFVLTQAGDAITGTHSMAIAGCGRLNEGGPVRGVAVGKTAVLVVTSGRNGAIAMGTAKVSRGKLQWRQVEEIKAGSPEGDSPLILGSGSLERAPQW